MPALVVPDRKLPGRFRHARWSLLLGCVALVYAFLLLAACGVVSWQSWDSASPWFHFQTDALLRGSLALSHNPFDLTHDLCWSQQSVQQVWGLGIPIWQSPWEALAKLLGFSPFPEFIALALFIGFVAYFVLSTWLGPLLQSESGIGPQTVDEKRWQWFKGLGAVSLFLLFPPLINLLRYRMLIYEEVMVYVYFWGILLVCLTIQLARNPRWSRFWILCALAGLVGFVRPTLVFYGFATLVIASLIMAGYLRKPATGNSIQATLVKSIGNPRLPVGVLLFVFGGGLLFVTNFLRFGSGWEFGQSLNLQGGALLPSVYFTRFGYPFKQVSLLGSGRELLGALFLDKLFNNLAWYASGIFPGQSPMLRWREMCFTTYDVSYAVFIALAWIVGMWAGRKWWHSSTSTPLSLYLVIILWSFIAAVLLFVFYMKVPVIASRYMLDFAPAFVAALTGLWCWLMEPFRKRMQYSGQVAGLLFAVLVLWQGAEMAYAQRAAPSAAPPIKDILAGQTLSTPKEYVPAEYRLGAPLSSQPGWRIEYNGAGWNASDGSLRLCAIFFVENPSFLEIELTVPPGQEVTEASLAQIEAKIGLETLQRSSISHTGDSWVLRFDGPKRQRYQQGLQPVFLATVAPQWVAEYLTLPTPWIMRRLSWRQSNSQP